MIPEKYLTKIKEIHGDKYDYSKTKYKNSTEKVVIICRIHGEFEQILHQHLRGHGCRKCKNEWMGKRQTLTTDIFVEKARKIHKNKYSYDKVNYLNKRSKVTILCSKHGEFEQSPQDHLAGCGCKFCKSEKIGLISRRSREEFIKKAGEAHNDRYIYDKVDYVNKYTKINIICPIHGDFTQIAHNHLNGQGCPRCKASKGELLIESILKRHKINFVAEFKIPDIEDLYFYDFYLPDSNLLIEFHGIQHYQYNKFFHKTYDEFLNRLIADKIKEELAKAWGYKYLCIKYTVLSSTPVGILERRLLNILNKN